MQVEWGSLGGVGGGRGGVSCIVEGVGLENPGAPCPLLDSVILWKFCGTLDMVLGGTNATELKELPWLFSDWGGGDLRVGL